MKKILRRVVMIFALAYFALALVSPLTRWGVILRRTDYEKLESDPIIVALCVSFILFLILLKEISELRQWKINKRGLLPMSITTIAIAAFVTFRGHTESAVLLLAVTSIQFGSDNVRKTAE